MKRRLNKNGYFSIYLPSHPRSKKGWYAEHRYVVEQFIGRILSSNEVVHHIDFNKQNNDLDNLMLFPSPKEHASFHNKVTQFGMTNPIKKLIKNRWEGYT